jgi:hypothetical protein
MKLGLVGLNINLGPKKQNSQIVKADLGVYLLLFCWLSGWFPGEGAVGVEAIAVNHFGFPVF